MKNVVNELVAFQEILNMLGDVKRSDLWPSDTERCETDIEHSYFLTMACWQIQSKLNLDFNQLLVFKYALVHDLPEVYAGDTPLFSSTQKKELQTKKEQQALHTLKGQLSNQEISRLIQEFMDQTNNESKFVKSVDSLVALLVQMTSKEAQFIKNKISKEDIDKALPAWRKRTDVSKSMAELTDSLLHEWFKVVKFYSE